MINYANNKLELSGIISSDFSFSHKSHEKNFFSFTLDVKRLSDYYDKLPILAEEHLAQKFKVGDFVNILGQFRSYNNLSGTGSKLILISFAQKIELTPPEYSNHIYLNGFICKTPIYRKTPLNRDICDIMLAVNRPFGKSDYIPCIAWGKNAKLASGLIIGDNIEIFARIQSRKYEKKNCYGILEKTAYEVSINEIYKII